MSLSFHRASSAIGCFVLAGSLGSIAADNTVDSTSTIEPSAAATCSTELTGPQCTAEPTSIGGSGDDSAAPQYDVVVFGQEVLDIIGTLNFVTVTIADEPEPVQIDDTP